MSGSRARVLSTIPDQTGTIVPAMLSTGAPSWDSSGNVTLSGNVSATSINSGPLAGFRNAIINGNFDIWQRGTSFNGASAFTYGADRWLIVSDGSGATRNISRQSFAIGQTDVPGEPVYFYRFNQSVAGSGGTSNNIEQRIESVRTFAGQTITISFYAKAASSLTMPSVAVGQIFGTGGSPSAAVYTVFATSLAVGTTWAKYTVTGTAPSITGKTLGSNNDDYLVLILQLPVNTTFTFDLAQVQLEAGPVATPFERRPLGTELALCERYYQVLGSVDLMRTSSTGTYGGGIEIVSMPTTMRVAPSVSLVFTGGNYNDPSTGTTTNTFRIWFASGSNVGDVAVYTVRLSAEL